MAPLVHRRWLPPNGPLHLSEHLLTLKVDALAFLPADTPAASIA
jgi:hypothetical protein